jgi:hypothetical protein
MSIVKFEIGKIKVFQVTLSDCFEQFSWRETYPSERGVTVLCNGAAPDSVGLGVQEVDGIGDHDPWGVVHWVCVHDCSLVLCQDGRVLLRLAT